MHIITAGYGNQSFMACAFGIMAIAYLVAMHPFRCSVLIGHKHVPVYITIHCGTFDDK